jgi:two-component system, response regulator FlrC
MSTGQANRDAPLVTSQAYPSHESTSRPAYHSPETPALLHGVPPSYAAAARDYSGSQPVITGVGADPFTPIVHDHPAPEVSTPAKGATGVTALVGRRMEDVERDLIIETLSHTFGNRTHAATILGISIRALRNKLRDYAAQGVAVPPPAAGVAA